MVDFEKDEIKPKISIENRIKLAINAIKKYQSVMVHQHVLFGKEKKGDWKPVKLFKPIREVIIVSGHENITATHETTLEFTKDDYLTPRGDCILGIKATKACKDFSEIFKKLLKFGCKVKVTIEVDNLKDEFFAYGSPNLILESENSIVIRKSNFIDERTLLILSEKSAKDIDRKIVEKLKNPDKEAIITFEINEKYF